MLRVRGTALPRPDISQAWVPGAGSGPVFRAQRRFLTAAGDRAEAH
jgi:hypothetical protein